MLWSRAPGPNHHTMKASRGVDIKLQALTISLDESQWIASHSSYFTPCKISPVPLDRMLGGLHNQSGHSSKKKKSLSLLEFKRQ